MAKCLFWNRFRFFVLGLGLIGVTSINSNLNSYNLTRLCMSPGKNASESGHTGYQVNYTEHEHNSLTMASAFGTLAGTVPFNWLYTRFGARYVFVLAGLTSALSTVLIPLSVRIGFGWVYALRFIQGFGFAGDFAAIGMICARWAPTNQNAMFISVLTCYTSLSTLLSSPLSGLLCVSSLGWESVFYGHSVICLVLTLLWAYFYTDQPSKSRFVSRIELERINFGKTDSHIRMERTVPYKAILSSGLVWVIWLNAFTELFSGVFSMVYQPSYMKLVLKFDIEKVGFLHIAGPVFHIPLKFVFGYLSDNVTFFSERTKMIICNTIAVFLPGFCYLGIAFIPTEYPWLHIAMYSLIGLTFASAGGGFYKCAAFYTRQYVHFVIANMQFTKALVMLIGPLIMNLFVSDMSVHSQWRNVFVPMAISVFVSNIIFCWVCTDEAADFTKDKTITTAQSQSTMEISESTEIH